MACPTPLPEADTDENAPPTISTLRPVTNAAAAELLTEGIAEAAYSDESELLLYTVTVCVTVDVEAAETAADSLFDALPGIKTSVTFCTFIPEFELCEETLSSLLFSDAGVELAEGTTLDGAFAPAPLTDIEGEADGDGEVDPELGSSGGKVGRIVPVDGSYRKV